MAKTNINPQNYDELIPERVSAPFRVQQPAPLPVLSPTPTPTPTAGTDSFIPGWVVLPLRLFLGISFLSAGFDKLTDPSYLNPIARSFIGRQVADFAPGTPLEIFLLNVVVPNATLFGVLVMGGELLVALATLTGTFTRFSSAMGLLLNMVFFLSATWTIRPFYYGPDLAYSFLWLPLLLGGPGPYALDARIKRWLTPAPVADPGKGSIAVVGDTSTTVTRRAFLGAGAGGLTLLALAATGFGWGAISSGKRVGTVVNAAPTAQPAATVVPPTEQPSSDSQGGTATQAPSTAVPTEAGTTTSDATNGLTKLAGPSDIPVNQSLNFTLSTGDPAVLVHNDSGYSAYIAICTHEGCQVSYFPKYKLIQCPCHGSEFDAASGGNVLRGPARRPLSPVELTVGPDGSIYLS